MTEKPTFRYICLPLLTRCDVDRHLAAKRRCDRISNVLRRVARRSFDAPDVRTVFAKPRQLVM